MDSAKQIKRLVNNLRKWCASPIVLDPPRLRGEIRKSLTTKHPRAVQVASTRLPLLANWYGQFGLCRVLDGDGGGWNDVERSLQYLWWAIRIEPSNVMVSRAACCLAHSMSSGREEYANWLAQRMLESVQDNVFMTWEHSPFAVFMVHLWALQNGASIPDLTGPRIADLGLYKGVLDAWLDSARLADFLDKICDYHLEQTRESLPLPEFVHIPYYLFPVELIAISRVRGRLGLPTPTVSHPLASTPLGTAPEQIMISVFDEDEAFVELVTRARMAGILQ